MNSNTSWSKPSITRAPAIALLRDEMGGRATFFVDSLSTLNLSAQRTSRMRCPNALVFSRASIAWCEFRDPLGPADESISLEASDRLRRGKRGYRRKPCQRLSRSFHFLTPDGTCYHGRMVSGGRASEAGPLALKRELRMQELEATRLEEEASAAQGEIGALETEIARADELLSMRLGAARRSGKGSSGCHASIGDRRVSNCSAPRISARRQRIELTALRVETETCAAARSKRETA